MDTHELESILTQRDLAAAERARDHVGPHAVFLANRYWQTQDWVERSLVVHMVQDQRGPHLRSLFSDFLHAPEQSAEHRDHVELSKAVCLVQLRGDLGLFARYEQDRALLRRDIQAELDGVHPLPETSPGPLAPRLLGTPTPIAGPADAPSTAKPMATATPPSTALALRQPSATERELPGSTHAAHAAPAQQAARSYTVIALVAALVVLVALMLASGASETPPQTGSSPAPQASAPGP